MNSSSTLPFDRAYWVAAGRLLVGCYPGDLDPGEARRKLLGLINSGVEKVINLMEPNEVGIGGKPFVDYRPPLEVLARESGQVVGWERLAIRDYDVPDAAQMQRILDAIDQANASGQIVYVHCWGGKGRTGTVVGCYLARHGSAEGDAVLQQLNQLTKAAPYDFGYVPQTPAQCEFVRKWGPGQ
jgi:hypothetical protein